MERYRKIFSKVPYGIIILNKNGVIEGINEYALKIFGWSEKFLIGKNFYDDFLNKGTLEEIDIQIQSLDENMKVVYINKMINKNLNGKMQKNEQIYKKIMIVDDEKLARLITRRMLEEIGCEVIEFSKGLEAIKFYEKHYNDIDIVLLDMVLKDISGQEVYGYLKNIYKESNIVVLTGNDNKQVRKKLNNSKVKIMQKPVTKEQLSVELLKVFYNRKIKKNTGASIENLSFDYKIGINYLEGNVELYDILLRDFIELYMDSIKRMSSYIIKSHEEAIRLAHNIKAVAASLGAIKLHEVAVKLEKHFINNGFNIKNVKMQELIEQLGIELNIFIVSINTYLDSKSNKNLNDLVVS